MNVVHLAIGVSVAAALAVTGVVAAGTRQLQLQGAASAAPPTGAISGVVRDGKTNRPIAGAVVTLQWPGWPRVTAADWKSTITDSKGRFVFTQLAQSDRYLIYTTKPSYTAGPTRQAFPVGSGVFGGSARIVLADGEWIDNIDIVLWPLGAISGTVVDERGEPVVGVPVRVLAQFPIAGAFQLVGGPVGKTDDRGIYRISGLPRGRYLVTLPSVQSVVPVSTTVEVLAGMTPQEFGMRVGGSEPPNSKGIDVGGWRLVVGNYATPPPPVEGRFQGYPLLFYPNASSALTATAIDLQGGDDRQNVDFALQPVSTVRVSGRVAGPAEAVTGLVVRLVPEGSENLGQGSEVATALVNANGGFTFLAVPAGRYTLVAQSTVSEFERGALGTAAPATPGMVNLTNGFTIGGSLPGGTTLSKRDMTGNDASFGRLYLDVGSDDVANVVVTLHRAAAISAQIVYEGETRPVSLFPSVEPASGSPASAVIGLMASNTLPRITAANRAATLVDTFTISGLKDDEYFLRVGAGVGGGKTLLVKSILVGSSL
jgi:hypothetical protein